MPEKELPESELIGHYGDVLTLGEALRDFLIGSLCAGYSPHMEPISAKTLQGRIIIPQPYLPSDRYVRLRRPTEIASELLDLSKYAIQYPENVDSQMVKGWELRKATRNDPLRGDQPIVVAWAKWVTPPSRIPKPYF